MVYYHGWEYYHGIIRKRNISWWHLDLKRDASQWWIDAEAYIQILIPETRIRVEKKRKAQRRTQRKKKKKEKRNKKNQFPRKWII